MLIGRKEVVVGVRAWEYRHPHSNEAGATDTMTLLLRAQKSTRSTVRLWANGIELELSEVTHEFRNSGRGI